jgi:hypothetical protein
MKRIKSLLLIWAALGMLAVPSFAKQMLVEPQDSVVQDTVLLRNYLNEPPLFPQTRNRQDCINAGCEWYCAPGMPPSPACCWC